MKAKDPKIIDVRNPINPETIEIHLNKAYKGTVTIERIIKWLSTYSVEKHDAFEKKYPDLVEHAFKLKRETKGLL